MSLPHTVLVCILIYEQKLLICFYIYVFPQTLSRKSELFDAPTCSSYISIKFKLIDSIQAGIIMSRYRHFNPKLQAQIFTKPD